MTALAELIGYIVLVVAAIFLAAQVLVPLSDLVRRAATHAYERILGLFY